MARYDFRSPRLYVDTPLRAGQTIALNRDQGNYLVNVLRLRHGDAVLVFNGREGEWQASLAATAKRPELMMEQQTRGQTVPCDLHYLFAPLKHARQDYMVQKAVEMGASRLQPVLTRHSQAARVNLDRMRANAIEAAEQCGILNIPEVADPLSLPQLIAAFEPQRLLIFCDEDAEIRDPVAALVRLRPEREGTAPLAVLVGPEGGFADDERRSVLALPNVLRLALGPRILRADTAAVAALALVGAVLGDWR